MDIGRKEIDRWHRQRGLFEIGYHAIIRRDGTLESGRPAEQIGAHAQGYNLVSLGVCLIGGVKSLPEAEPEANYTPAQVKSLNALLAGWHQGWGEAKIVGHSELPSPHARLRYCPSFNVQAWLAEGQPLDISPFNYGGNIV